MAKHKLNMSINHCPNWGFWEAVREILQNGDDEQQENPENKFEVIYDPEKEKLILKNKKSILEKESLLIGYSTKRDNKETTGKYGEGYKVSLAVLSRLGKRVVIKNYHNKEKWNVIVENEEVKVDINKFIFKSVPDNNLTWEILNVTQEDWESIQSYYLPFVEDLKVIKTSYGMLIKNPELQGNIYVNNLFIENVKDLDYAYSFPSTMIELDRDRKAVKMFDMQYNASLILSNIENGNESINMFEMLKSDSKEAEYLPNTLSNASVKEIKESFVREHTDNSYPVSTQEDYDLISRSFRQIKPVFVKERLKKTITRNEEYETPNSLIKSLGLDSDESVLETPRDILINFYLKYKQNLSYYAEKELSEILELSENWHDKKDVKDFDSEFNPSHNELDEITEEGNKILEEMNVGNLSDFEEDCQS